MKYLPLSALLSISVVIPLGAHATDKQQEGWLYGAGLILTQEIYKDTSAKATPVPILGYKGEKHELPKLTNSYASFFKDKLMKIQYNLSEDKHGWRHLVK